MPSGVQGVHSCPHKKFFNEYSCLSHFTEKKLRPQGLWLNREPGPGPATSPCGAHRLPCTVPSGRPEGLQQGRMPSADAVPSVLGFQCLARAGWRPGQEKGVKLGSPAKGVVYGVGGS